MDQREWGNCIQIAAASGVTAAKHCGHTGVTSPGLLAHTCDLSKLEVVRGREPGELQDCLKQELIL